MKQIQVRISDCIANEYQTRDAYDFISKAGMYRLTLDQARELRDDAIFNALHVECMPRGAGRAYRALAQRLIADLGMEDSK